MSWETCPKVPGVTAACVNQASALADTLKGEPHSIPTLTCSIDQFYLTRKAQQDLAQLQPSNDLIRHRGQPSTHDLPLAIEVLLSLRRGLPTKIPSFDKSAFNGEGDRNLPERWRSANEDLSRRARVLILEGWCIGFAALPASALIQKWSDAIRKSIRQNYHSRLANSQLSSLAFVNSALQSYDELSSFLDCLIHLDAEDPLSVYEWRLQQEHALWDTSHAGMTDEQVINFVDDYYPAYELYSSGLRGQNKIAAAQRLRVILGSDRRIVDAFETSDLGS